MTIAVDLGRKATKQTNKKITCLNMPKFFTYARNQYQFCTRVRSWYHVLMCYEICMFTPLFGWLDCLRPINNLSGIKRRVFLGWTSTKLGLMYFAQRLNAVTPVRLKPAAPRSRVKHSTVAYTIVSIYAVPFDGAHGIGVQTRYKSI